ncbi:hypothetical protein GCM10011369_04150 [Neiella marina]|uniref:Uncharacterized protein n=1 Tax=Neiella marina TaxID=508461 RepID=A0A8J2U299_9GAMM|nr:hypothetical protein [Neiella marina]GGA65806.1 hypothetical protein GCM10011369_04150 [Neiella marina]
MTLLSSIFAVSLLATPTDVEVFRVTNYYPQQLELQSSEYAQQARILVKYEVGRDVREAKQRVLEQAQQQPN